MKIKDGYDLSFNDGQYTVISNSAPLKNVISLNNETAFIFKFIQKNDRTKEEIFNAVISNFNISAVLALSDVDIFIKLMKENDIIDG